jgi:hypothetical protein
MKRLAALFIVFLFASRVHAAQPVEPSNTLLRTTTPNVVMPLTTFRLSGNASVNDMGVGCNYSSVGATSGGLRAIQDASGTWFNLVPDPVNINVGCFGVVADGVTDDRAAMQAAIDYASANKGTRITLPCRQIHLSDYLLIPSNTTMVGCGPLSRTGTQFLMSRNDFIHFPSGAITYYVYLEGFSVNTPDNGLVWTDALLGSTSHLIIRRVVIHAAHKGLWIKCGIARGLFEDLVIEGGEIGIYMDPADPGGSDSPPTLDQLTFINTRLVGQSQNGINWSFPGPALNITFIGLHLVNIGQHGFVLDANGSGIVFINASDEQGAGAAPPYPTRAKTTGSITAATNSLVVASATGFTIGDPITVQGAGTDRRGNPGLDLHTTIDNIVGTTFTLHDNAAFTVSNLAITNAQYDVFNISHNIGTSNTISFYGGIVGIDRNTRYAINFQGAQHAMVTGMVAEIIYDPYRVVSMTANNKAPLRQPPIDNFDAFERVSFPYYDATTEFSQTVVSSPPGRDIVAAMRSSTGGHTGAWGAFKVYKGRDGTLSNNVMFMVNANTGSEGDTSVWGNRIADGKRGVVQTYVKAGTPVDGDLNNAANGTMVVDSTAGKLWNRIGGAWKSAWMNSGQINTITKTSGTGGTNTLTANDSGSVANNCGAGGIVDFTLPTPTNQLVYSFQVCAAQQLKVIAASGAKIYVGTSASAANGNILSSAIGTSIKIIANGTDWVAETAPSATWTINWLWMPGVWSPANDNLPAEAYRMTG